MSEEKYQDSETEEYISALKSDIAHWQLSDADNELLIQIFWDMGADLRKISRKSRTTLGKKLFRAFQEEGTDKEKAISDFQKAVYEQGIEEQLEFRRKIISLVAIVLIAILLCLSLFD